MGQSGAVTRKATHELKDIEAREVSPVDRAANAKKWLIRKDAVGPRTEEPMKTTAQKNAGQAPPPATSQPVAQGAPPAAPPAAAPPAPSDNDAVAGGADEAASAAVAGATMVVPVGAKAALVTPIREAMARLATIADSIEQATETEGAEMPTEPVVAVADVAGAMASAVEPFVAKTAGHGMMSAEAKGPPPAEGDVETAKGEFVPWTQEYIDSLCDGCFLYVAPSTERNTDYQTIPLSNRMFPIRDHAWRLSLPMVIAAVEGVAAGTEPFLSEQKKRGLMLRLASMRLDEAMIAAYCEQPMAPETAAELAAIAQFLGSIASVGMPAPAAPAGAPAEGAPPAPVEGAMPPAEGGQFGDAMQKCAAVLKSFADASKAGASVGKAQIAKLAEVADAMKVANEKMAGFLEEAQKALLDGDAAAPLPNQVGAPPALPEPKVQTAKAAPAAATDETAKLRAQLDQSQRTERSLRDQIAKNAAAMRATTGSSVSRDEPANVAKSEGAYVPPVSRDLNDDFDREKRAKSNK